ncbi:MAG TPA: flagellar filament capping protein FliD [Anaeromyxobacteraceae bacterium]|nr:flagellar filament capping protein FliD [Anaeromyxobacteraceae bacterium]
MSTITPSSTTPAFTAGGLASTLDTNSIIDGLVSLQQRPLDLLKSQQTGLQAQISTLGSIASRLSALGDAARALGTSGALAVSATSSNTSFSASPGAGAAAGSYSIQVTELATVAKARTTAFGSADKVKAGSLDIAVDGVHYPTDPTKPITWQDGASLADVVAAISASGAPVSAAVLFDGTSSYLSITKRDTGYAMGSDPAQALVVTETTTGTTGRALGINPFQPPTNAAFTLDGLPFARTSNVIGDAVPGTTLTLRSKGGDAEELTLANDIAGTKAKLQTYVNAYNGVIQIVQQQLTPAANTDRTASLAGSATLRSLQQTLQAFGSQEVPGLGTIRTLADVGVKTNRDGTLSIDDTVLGSALVASPNALNALFTKASTGLAATVGALADQYVKSGTGLLSLAQSGLNTRAKQMDDEQTQLQARLDAYRASLQAQFTAMEQIVSKMKNVGSFLTSQSAMNNK